ncbi:MAG TPA: hypothetical protein VJ963_08545, partial [Bacteroidales bacterium]|nr:hypothetical protein [Bacteroidales bacterium]
AAGMFDVNLGYLIIVGILFAIPGALAAYLWSKWLTGKGNYPPASEPEVDPMIDHEKLPSPFLSFLPVVVPLLLITLRSVLILFDKEGQGILSKIFYIPGEPVFALAVGVVLSLFLIRGKTMDKINSIFTEAIEKAGPILIVTAAGGMFGMVIRETGTGEAMGKLLAGTSLGLLVPFLIAMVMKTAQGSSTVAIITTASFVAPMLPALGLGSEAGKLFAMLSMGAGSMLVSHANDSYFWVVSKFADIDSTVNLKVYSSTTIVMGVVIFLCIWITSLFIL